MKTIHGLCALDFCAAPTYGLWVIPMHKMVIYKNYEQVFRDIMLKEKMERNMPLIFKPTNVVPTVNYAWDCSFAIGNNNEKAILDRGWYPSNRALETSPDVLRTKTASDDCNVLCIANQTSSLLTITCDMTAINPSMGAAARLLEAAINNQKNNPTAKKKRRNAMSYQTKQQ
jgi:hypothetical protein